jgi:hypothetical protein
LIPLGRSKTNPAQCKVEKKVKEAPIVPPRGKSETIKVFNGTSSTAGKGTATCGAWDGVIVAKNTDPIKVAPIFLPR